MSSGASIARGSRSSSTVLPVGGRQFDAAAQYQESRFVEQCARQRQSLQVTERQRTPARRSAYLLRPSALSGNS